MMMKLKQNRIAKITVKFEKKKWHGSNYIQKRFDKKMVKPH